MGMILKNKLIQALLALLLVHHHIVNLLAQISSCNTSSAESQSCANLGNNIPYPFASNASPSACAFPSSFLLSNCSSQQAYWDALSRDYDITQNLIGPPAVMGISSVNYSTYINLTWDSDLISHPTTHTPACSAPVPRINLSQTIPPAIDLSSFADKNIRLSSNNVFLLFNCTHSTSDDLTQLMDSSFQSQNVEANSSLCQYYRQQCSTLIEGYYTTQCVQLIPYSYSSNLDLQHAMETLGCTHFQFFVTKTGANDFAITEWSKSILQLQWTDSNCWNCFYGGGSCVMDSTNRTFEKCNCNYGVFDGFSCYSAECEFSSRFSICHRIVKIAVSMVVIVGTLALLLALYLWRRIRRRRSIKSIEIKVPKFPRKSAWPRQELSSGSNESLNDFDLNGLSERPMEYSYSLIASATSSFSSVVGEGGFGVVFKGALDDQEIAVKVLEVKSKHSRKQFLNEVAIIGRIHHVNVVRLLGFCVQKEEHEMLVYEYVVNGSLDTWLFRGSKRAGGDHGEEELEWGQRYGIALGVARGLSYLHEECRHRIVHCDIKPQNILLDAYMCPKIADFGLARLMSRDESRVVTLAKGTPGYMAPEFWVGGDIQLSTKADVYSYGMVLLELVSGRRNFALGCRRFPTVACEAAMRGDFESIVDVRLQVDTARSTEEQRFLMRQQVRTAIFVALWCIQEHPNSRPCMSEVVQYLEGIAPVSEQPPWPAIASVSTTPPLPAILLDSSSHLPDFTPMTGGR